MRIKLDIISGDRNAIVASVDMTVLRVGYAEKNPTLDRWEVLENVESFHAFLTKHEAAELLEHLQSCLGSR